MQLGMPVIASLTFLGIVADILEQVEADLCERKLAWDHEQRRLLEEQVIEQHALRVPRGMSRPEKPETFGPFNG